jgi:hypothetical protein
LPAVLIFDAVKKSVPGSPSISDRTELLRNVGPVDYTEEASNDFFLNESAEESQFSSQRTPSQRPTATRPQTLPVERRYGDRLQSRQPLRGIFDDV